MKKHCLRSAGRFPLIFEAIFLSIPDTALAMGGEGIAEGLLTLAFWFVVWLIAFAMSFRGKTKPWTFERYARWAIRLSFPVWIAWSVFYGIHIAPKISQQRDEQNELLRNSARQQFSNLCQQRASHATQILKVVDSEFPRRILVDQPDELYGLEVSLKLANCVTNRASPACSGLKLESIEWAWLHSPGFAPCKRGTEPGNGSCLPEYKRYDLGDRKFSYIEIDQPTSEYVIRVEKPIKTGEGFEEVRKYQVSLEEMGTRQLLAKTEILANWAGPAPCPNPENEVAQMLLRVFPTQ